MPPSELMEGELPAPLKDFKTCDVCEKGKVCIVLSAHVKFMMASFGPDLDNWPIKPAHLGILCSEGPNYKLDIREADVVQSVLKRAKEQADKGFGK